MDSRGRLSYILNRLPSVTPALRRRRGGLIIFSGDLTGQSSLRPPPLASPLLNDYIV